MPVTVVVSDAMQIFNRLFDHRAAIQGETMHFCGSFDSALDRQFDRLLRDSHRLREADDALGEAMHSVSELDRIGVKTAALQAMLEKIPRAGAATATAAAHDPHAAYIAQMTADNEVKLQAAIQQLESEKLAVEEEFRTRVQEISANLNALNRCV